MPTSATTAISVRVLLFGSYAETLGWSDRTIELAAPANVAAAVAAVRAIPGASALPPRVLCAVNLMHAGPTTPLSDGDELAILPPLAGG